MPRGESSRENSPLTLRISEDSMFGDRITTLSSRSYRRTRGRTRIFLELSFCWL